MSVNSSEVDNCHIRILERVPPDWVIHSEAILNKHNGCSVSVIFELSEVGKINEIGSNVEIQDCKRFQKSAETSVIQYRFSEGKRQQCTLKLTFELEDNGT
jgi:hypothetical protein